VLPWSQATVQEVRDFMGVPKHDNLVVTQDGESQFLQPHETIQLVEGMGFHNVPRFRWGRLHLPPTARRLQMEASLLSAAYNGGVEWSLDTSACTYWLRVPRFRLPRGWNANTTQIMVTVSDSYPQLPPDGFYLNRYLRDAYGRRPGHYFEERSAHNAFADRGWAWFCIHVETWNSSIDPMEGDSIIKYLGLIYDVMSLAVRPR
jgi:hypothetical protein